MAITLIGRGLPRRTRRAAPAKRPAGQPDRARSTAFRLMTLNVAHARRHGRHQALLSESTLRENLSAIATVLRREAPDVVGLQEADGPSAWSGGFDHVAMLAELGEFPHAFRGEHNPFSLGRFDLSSGTALLARHRLDEAQSHAFGQNWRDTKGFVAATVAPEALGARALDVVSIHLDFLAERVRGRQIDQLIERFRGSDRPLVVLGDFNCEWNERKRSLDRLRQELALRPCDATGNATFPSWRPLVRLDWILVSEELDFASYDTLPDRLSDHLGVVADVRLRGTTAGVSDEDEPTRVISGRGRSRRA